MLSVDDVTFSYVAGAPVLADIDFKVASGEVVAIVGRNGAGKSTLLRLLNGLFQPESGAIIVAGNATSDTPVHILARSIGTVFQAPEQQIFNPRVRDEIAFGPKQLGLTGATLEARIAEVLERIGLASEADAHPLDLDQSARRMVAIGSVLAMQPPILLLDEAQRGLDKTAITRLSTIIETEKARGTAVILVCHDMDFVARQADRVLGLARGRLAANLPTKAFFTDKALTASIGVEVPDVLALSEALALPPTLTPAAFADAYMARERT
ncbi:energy-coupling factor transport system ATP-binding protein [Kaistia soli DSM 19436]|uniref:Energy-coupling factor transport system ATP-binding protein n=1 Tax=Kaistia soli DSM 19436 TaxID=1122133 RepID=A0A1M5FYZ9_9HYPH|nr:ABC transporter ATP-binding protein [Kaistia soli]SHF96780.1 energy-coupling factor transport system ATP-binding protein [Kaistia soli DSM 19436]